MRSGGFNLREAKVSEEIQRKNQTVSPRSGAVATPRGGARAGAGRKPDPFKNLLNVAIKNIVNQEEMDAVVRSLVDKAKSGDVQAANSLFDRMVGKVPQAVQHQGDTTAPFKIIVEYSDK